MNKLIQRSFLDAIGTVAYIALVALFFQNGERLFGDGKNILIPITMLTLFVLSASVTGGLVLGKPILMYIDGKKKDAVTLFLYTLGWLALAVVLVLIGVGLFVQR